MLRLQCFSRVSLVPIFFKSPIMSIYNKIRPLKILCPERSITLFSLRPPLFLILIGQNRLIKLELNDQKRLATSGANFARAYTVQFGTCTFPYNFTGCQDLAKLKKVPFISDDLELECKGKDKFKCGSNVFWKW